MTVLVLNSGYMPVNIVSNHDAARKLFLSYDALSDKLDGTFPTEYFAWHDLDDLIPDRKDIVTLRTPNKIMTFNNVIVEASAPFRQLIRPTLNYNYILMRDNRTCVYCGDRATTVDHVIPKSKGGKDSWKNLVAACRSCNARKANKDLTDFMPNAEEIIRETAKIPASKEALFAAHLHPEWRQYIFYE